MAKAPVKPVTHFGLVIIALYALYEALSGRDRTVFFYIDDILRKTTEFAEKTERRLVGKRTITIWKNRLTEAIRERLVCKDERNRNNFQLTDLGRNLVRTAKLAIGHIAYDNDRERIRAVVHKINDEHKVTTKKTCAELLAENDRLEMINAELEQENNTLRAQFEDAPPQIMTYSTVTDRPAPNAGGRVKQVRAHKNSYKPYPSRAPRAGNRGRRSSGKSTLRAVGDTVASSSGGPIIAELREKDVQDVDVHPVGVPGPESPSSNEDDLRSLRRELVATKLERDELQTQADELAREKQALLDRRAVLEGQAQEKARELERISEEREHLVEELRQSNDKVTELTERCELMTHNESLKKSTVARVVAQYEARLRTQDAKVKFLDTSLATCEQALAENKTSRKTLVEEVASLKAELRTMKEAQQNDLKQREETLRELCASKAEAARLRKELERLREEGVEFVFKLFGQA